MTVAIVALLLIQLHLPPLLAAGIDCPVSGFQFSPSLAVHVLSNTMTSPVNTRDIVCRWPPTGVCHLVRPAVVELVHVLDDFVSNNQSVNINIRE